VTVPATRRRAAGCPSSLALDELLAGDLEGRAEEGPLREHVAGCAECRARLEARAGEPALIPDPVTLRPRLEADLAVARSSRRRRAARWVATAGAASATAAAILLSLRARPPELSGERTKGALALTLHVKRAATGGSTPATVQRIYGEGRLRAGDEVRFSLAAAGVGQRVVVLGLDAAPSVTIYVPGPSVTGDAPARAAAIETSGAVILPGSVVADATRGFERMVAVVCDQEIAPEALRRQAQVALARAGGRPEMVASLGTGCIESAVLVRKEQP
jgi:hypothetical protein